MYTSDEMFACEGSMYTSDEMFACEGSMYTSDEMFVLAELTPDGLESQFEVRPASGRGGGKRGGREG